MARLIVVSGLPGTGKTTLAQALVRELKAVYLRVDAVETPLIRAGIQVNALGYEVVREVAASNLTLGAQVVLDLVNPLPLTRQMWRDLAGQLHVPLTVFECHLPDPDEHQRRVQTRTPDLPGQVVPTWQEVQDRQYVPWDETRDGPRMSVDMTDTTTGLHHALAALGLAD